MAAARTRWLSRSYPLRVHLIAYGMAVLLPVMILAGVLLGRSAALERAQLEARLGQIAGNLASDIDRDIDRHLTVLRTLSTSHFLAQEDWQGFYLQAKAALDGTGFLVVIDGSLRQLLNTRVPFGAQPAVTGDPETAQRMLKTGQPDVSDLFFSLIDKRPVFNVNLPVVSDGKVRYILIFAQNAEHLLPVLRSLKLPPSWHAAVLDRKGIALASEPRHESEVGKAFALPPERLDRAWRTVSEAAGPDGGAWFRVWEQSQLSGWVTAVSIPLSEVQAPLYRSSWVWALVALFAALLAAVLGWLFARTMTRPIGFAADAARALGAAQPVAGLKSSLAEANDLVTAMERAAIELTERDRHQKLLMSELNHRVKNILTVVQAIAMRTLDGQQSVSDARRAFQERLRALGRAHDVLTRTDWRGAPIREIVDAELAPFSSRAQARGPDLVIVEHWVQTFALVLHELATNAAKHGALSGEKGSVSIAWRVSGADKEARFHFRWEEKDGPAVTSPTHIGFGSAILERAVAADLGAKPRLAYDAAGFVYEIEAPRDAVVRGSTV